MIVFGMLAANKYLLRTYLGRSISNQRLKAQPLLGWIMVNPAKCCLPPIHTAYLGRYLTYWLAVGARS